MYGRQRLMMVALMVAVMCAVTEGAEYYLSPDGDDEAAGTREAPWQTLERASETADAGDTVILLPGRYEGQLRPVNSGTADAPIVFRAEPRLSAVLIGESGERTIAIEDVEHIRIEGLHVDPDGGGRGWLTIRNASHITVDDCRMENSTYGLAAHVDRTENVRVHNSVFQRQTGGGNMFRVSNSTRIVIEGNSISRAGHSPLQFFPQNTNRYIVIRGNVFHAAWGRPFEFFHDRDVLFEHNIIAHAFNSGWSNTSNAKLGFTRGIVRFNRTFRNPHSAISMYPWRDEGALNRMRLYNNVWDDTGDRPIAIRSGNEDTRDITVMNNVFSRNSPHVPPGPQPQLILSSGSPEQTRVVRNVFTGSEPGLPVVRDYGEDFTVEQLDSDELRAEHGVRYRENVDVDPGYVDPDNYNHALREDSPLRDAGHFLTTARDAGEGNLLAVEDAAFFYDGFGIDGEQGDIIAVGAPDQQATVTRVDHESNALHLDRDLTWSDGAPVSLPWSGVSPDIGVYEHGDDGRVTVQVATEPFEVQPGEQVTLRALVHGAAQPEHTHWWLGDGNVAQGTEVTHAYEDEYDYAIRVAVLDTEGRTHRGTGYVWVTEAVDPTEPLIHSTWCPDDEMAWWLWKSYRPMPAAFRDVIEDGVRHGPNTRGIPEDYELPGEGVNYRHIMAPEADSSRLPALLRPDGWDIDLYPEVFVRYRVGEGTPLVLLLKPFGRSALVVALSPAGDEDLTPVADYVLHDDQQWHELSFDVRKVREIYPELQVLEALQFFGRPVSAVEKGHWFDLDEVIIRPATTQ